MLEKKYRRDGTQDGITQKLEALVIVEGLLPVTRRRMRDGSSEQRLVFELIAKDFLGLGYLARMRCEHFLIGHN